MRAISLRALMTVIERHKLKPSGGQYHFTDEMASEAIAIDEAKGTGMSKAELEDLKAAIERRPNSGDWKEADNQFPFIKDCKGRLQ
jgi:hypothetical protein